MCCDKHKRHDCDKRQPVLFIKHFRCTEMLCFCGKTFCCSDGTSKKHKFSCKALKKRVLKLNAGGILEKYRRVLDGETKITTTNRGFRRHNHAVTTYEQIKIRLGYFRRKRSVESDGIHNQPLNL